eukprot:4341471-Pyramimonas_sp.AAC.1
MIGPRGPQEGPRRRPEVGSKMGPREGTRTDLSSFPPREPQEAPRGPQVAPRAVSYTHLTLPTILLV